MSCWIDSYDARSGLNHLAKVLADQGDLDGARTLHERASVVFEIRLSPTTPQPAMPCAGGGDAGQQQ